MITLLRTLAWFYFLSPKVVRGWLEGATSFVLKRVRPRISVIESNLKRAFPGNESLQADLAMKAYEHLARLIWGILMVLGPFKRYVLESVELWGFENWKAAHSLGRGVILLGSHQGNWEMMSARVTLAGADGLMVTKKLKPSWFHEAFERGRATCGIRGTYEPRTFKDVLSHLKKGGGVGVVLDQYAGPPVGIRVPFFGVPVGTQSAIAVLARRTGSPVLPVANYRKPDGRWVVEIQPPVEWIADEHPEREIARNTARYTEVLEKLIRAHPDQWLWTHRRFKGDLSELRPGEWEEGRPRR